MLRLTLPQNQQLKLRRSLLHYRSLWVKNPTSGKATRKCTRISWTGLSGVTALGLFTPGKKGDELRFKRVYADGTRYFVSRSVQLISLNGGKTPFVYVLPFIDASKKQLRSSEDPAGPDRDTLPTHRPLDQFESDALKELQAGKEVVLTGKGEGRELIGAIRAAASCTKCHEVHQDALLGAFRYPLEDESRKWRGFARFRSGIALAYFGSFPTLPPRQPQLRVVLL